MPIGEPPPLHKDAITAATERADTFTVGDRTLSTGELERFPTPGLEPFQKQRAEALKLAHTILGKDAMTEDVIRAASFIECGRLPDG